LKRFVEEAISSFLGIRAVTACGRGWELGCWGNSGFVDSQFQINDRSKSIRSDASGWGGRSFWSLNGEGSTFINAGGGVRVCGALWVGGGEDLLAVGVLG